MNIKRGYFTTLCDGSEYQAVSIKKDKNGKYKIKSTNPNDLNNGFRKYNDTVFVRTVSENEIIKIEHIQPYAIFKNDPDKNIFSIIEKNDGNNYENKLVLATTNCTLAKKFGFGPCGFGPGTFEKTVSINEVKIKHKIDEIFLNKSKNISHKGTDQSLSTMKIVAGQPQEVPSNRQKFVFGFVR